MIKRAITEATDEAINKALANDAAGRIPDLLSFVRLIDRIQGNYSLFLDAPWGYGKTFFVKSAATILRDGNEYTQLKGGAGVGFANAAELENLHLPIYFNAWECDYRDDPIASLIETLIDGFDELKGSEKIGVDIREAGLSAIKALSVSLGPINMNLSDACEGAASHDVTQPLRRDREVRGRLMSMLDKVLEERGERIVLFIDELDRCRPFYSVRLLEAVKFLFDHDRLTVVFSVDSRMLARAVRGCYGADFDGEAYLSRFYDMLFKLPAVDADKRLSMGGFWARGRSLLWDVSREITKRGDMSLRDLLKYTDLLTLYSTDGAANESQAREGSTYIRNVVGPLLLCCSFVDAELLERFLSCDEAAFREFWKRFEGIEIFSRNTMLICQAAKKKGLKGCETPEGAFASFVCPLLLGLDFEGKSQANEILPTWQNADEDFADMLHKLHLG